MTGCIPAHCHVTDRVSLHTVRLLADNASTVTSAVGLSLHLVTILDPAVCVLESAAVCLATFRKSSEPLLDSILRLGLIRSIAIGVAIQYAGLLAHSPTTDWIRPDHTTETDSGSGPLMSGSEATMHLNRHASASVYTSSITRD